MGTARAKLTGFGALSGLFVCAAALIGHAQQGVVVRDFRVALDRWPVPNERQVKTLIEGESAQPQTDGIYLVRGARLTTFTQSGLSNIVIVAPEAHLDQKQKLVSSPGPLQVGSADGKFSIAGVGFLWRETNSLLVISNQVQTVVHPDLLGESAVTLPTTNNSRGPIKIVSDRFEYGAENQMGTYLGNVQATGTNLVLSGGTLKVEVPMPGRLAGRLDAQAATAETGEQRPQVRSITIDDDIVLDYQGIHATGQHAVYSTAEGLLLVSGQPQWRTAHREGSADQISIEPSNRIFRAVGNATLSLSGPELSQGSFLGGLGTATTQDRPVTNREVRISSKEYEVRTNSAVFTDEVVVHERIDDQDAGSLRCETMELSLAGTNQLRKLVAERGVTIEEGSRRFSGGKLVYDAMEETLQLTENPGWRDGAREGGGQEMHFDMRAEEMLVSGNAWMRLPAGEIALATTAALARTTNAAAATNAFAEISSREYRLGKTTGEFRGEVHVSHPQMNWTSDVVRLRFPPEGGGTVEEIVAEPAEFTMKDPKGQTITGHGVKAVYTCTISATATNSLLELTGSPASLSMTNGMTMVSRVIFFDVASSKLFAPQGGYKISGKAGGAGDTNAFRFPKAFP